MSIDRDVMEYDVVVVGGGPSGLAAACRLKQLAAERHQDISVCLVEKGAEIGAHILSGAVFEPRALDELFPDWKQRGAPLHTPVLRDDMYLLRNDASAFKVPPALVPRSMHNHGNYVISLGRLCRWLGEQAEALGVEIYPGFAAQQVIIEDGVVRGIITGDMGLNRQGQQKSDFAPGMALRARYTILAEGCRGHLGKQLIAEFKLDVQADPQHYGIGIKELWEIPPDPSRSGLVVHGAGWPLADENPGGWFLYHLDERRISVGLIVDLSYANPYLSPFDEFQRLKHHPLLAATLSGGKRISYGARAICKGGYSSLPRMIMPGAALVGCDLGTLNAAKIKGSHTAMKSGMLCAEAIADALVQAHPPALLDGYVQAFKRSWLHDELFAARNFSAAIHKFGTLVGGALNSIEQNWLGARAPWTLHDRIPDHQALKPASDCSPIDYPKPDGRLSFDKLSSVFLSSTHHEEDQPVHLKLHNPLVPIADNLPRYDEPAQRYCPAGVYEIQMESDGARRFQINAQNCVHCKTCDIKDPAQNITWVAPEGGGGPSYADM